MSSLSQVSSQPGGGSGMSGIKTINTIVPDGTGNFTIAAGTGITITPGTNEITINGSASGITTIDGDSGSITGSTVTIKAGTATVNSGSSVSFVNSGTVSTLNLTDASLNTMLGGLAGNATMSGFINTAVGYQSSTALTSGGSNVSVGENSLLQLTTGSGNVVIGHNAGRGYTSSESNNIVLGPSFGTAGQSGEMWLGDFTNTATTYIAGVSGVTVSNINAVTINTVTGQLGSQAVPGGVTINGDTGSATGSTITFTAHVNNQYLPTFAASGSTVGLNFEDGNANIVIGNQNGALSIAGAGNIGIGHIAMGASPSGNNNTGIGYGALNSLSSGNNNVAIGEQSLTVLPGGTGNVCIGGFQGGINYGGTESYNILIVNQGVASENNTLRIGEGTGTGNFQINQSFISGINGNTVSNTMMVTIDSSTDQLGTAAMPSSGITTLTADAGIPTTNSSIEITTGYPTQCGSTVLFTSSGSEVALTIGDANNNHIMGINAGNTSVSGMDNVSFGENTLTSLTSGSFNTGMGTEALLALTTGSYNVAIGGSAASVFHTGSFNVAIGGGAGSAWTSSESNNVAILDLGVAGDTGVTRINTLATGSDGGASACYIGGIQTIVVTGTPVLVSTADQLGVAASSAKFKNNIKDMAASSASVLNLRPVTFQWNKESSIGLKNAPDTIQYGLIAEEVHNVMPDMVIYDKNGDPFSVDYSALAPMLLNEIQKLNKRIEALEYKVGV